MEVGWPRVHRRRLFKCFRSLDAIPSCWEPALIGRPSQPKAVHGTQLSAGERPHSRDIVSSPGGLKCGILQLLGARGSKHLSRVNQPFRLCRITSFEIRQDRHQRSQRCSFERQVTQSLPCKISAIWSAVLFF